MKICSTYFSITFIFPISLWNFYAMLNALYLLAQHILFTADVVVCVFQEKVVHIVILFLSSVVLCLIFFCGRKMIRCKITAWTQDFHTGVLRIVLYIHTFTVLTCFIIYWKSFIFSTMISQSQYRISHIKIGQPLTRITKLMSVPIFSKLFCLPEMRNVMNAFIYFYFWHLSCNERNTCFFSIYKYVYFLFYLVR